MSFIINIICGSCKHHDELKAAKAAELTHLKDTDKLETRKGANQIFTLKRAGDTRLGSHFYFVCNLIQMFGATSIVLQDITCNIL